MLKTNRFWIVLLSGVLIISGAAALALLKMPAKGGAACVYQDGTPLRRIDLSAVTEPYSFIVEYGGGINLITVERGRISVSEADCPDRACVRQGWISDGSSAPYGAAPLVCLPHRLVIRLESAETPDVDAVAG